MADMGAVLESAVIFLFADSQSGQVPIGTAFIVSFPVRGGSSQFVPLVVTAKHVIADNARVFGRFSTKEGKAPFTVECNLDDLRRMGDYWEHPDAGVDIAVFRIPHFQRTEYQPVSIDLVASEADFREAVIQATDRVVMPGLLVNYMGLSRNYPIMRSGSIALISEESVPMQYSVGRHTVCTSQRVLFIDAAVVQGESGSPVFLWPGPRLKGSTFAIGGTRPLLLGVLHGFYPAYPRKVETIEAGTTEVFRENSGIAIAFPSWCLREILELPTLAKRIQQILSEDDR